jgi:hypothetical protein
VRLKNEQTTVGENFLCRDKTYIPQVGKNLSTNLSDCDNFGLNLENVNIMGAGYKQKLEKVNSMATLFSTKNLCLTAIGVTLITLGAGQTALATTLTFDDLPAINYFELIPNGYGGFSWDNFFYNNGRSEISIITGPGYETGLVSGNYAASNGFGRLATLSVSDGVFNFGSAYLTAAWFSDLSITIEGLKNGASLYSKTVVVDFRSPTLFNFNYFGIDELEFTSSFETNQSYFEGRTQFVLDNFTFNRTSIPEPNITSGALTAIGIGIAFKRKLKHKSI